MSLRLKINDAKDGRVTFTVVGEGQVTRVHTLRVPFDLELTQRPSPPNPIDLKFVSKENSDGG